MSADWFHVWYGIRLDIKTADASSVEALELRQHPWQVAARQHQLQSWWGRTEDEQRMFVLLGRIVGHFGWEAEPSCQLTEAEASGLVAETNVRLRSSGIDIDPAWHFQFEPDQ